MPEGSWTGLCVGQYDPSTEDGITGSHKSIAAVMWVLVIDSLTA
jgi:hypothetical protein